ncbi:ribosomal protein S5 domain 2-type protein [Gautieria morchelliformis]|nr:ribosomal protein S5 domain 2-type protein [Gautieria morchelliformis]
MRFPLYTRRVVQQSGKGKIYTQYAMIVVGNGRGLVGLGEGKAQYQPHAAERAFAQAVRNMDWVERFEERTLWGEVSTKLGAVKVVMRPRPVGFGLMCAPGVHQVMKAAGVRDVSVKVWGSRNKMGVVKAVVRALQSGSAMVGMGDGVGGEARRMEAGAGLRGKAAVERERGRRILDARTW